MNDTTGNTRVKVKAALDIYSRLHDGLSNMIENGRLKESDIPDDYEWLVETLVEACGANPSMRAADRPVAITMTAAERRAIVSLMGLAEVRRDQWATFADRGVDEEIDAYDVIEELYQSGQQERDDMVQVINHTIETTNLVVKRFEAESNRMAERYGRDYVRYE